MAKRFARIEDDHRRIIGEQQMFFVATAARDGRVNLSPKGMDSFRILGPDRIAWLNLTGSGNETAAHLLDNARMTVMFCSFTQRPMILRLYGTARAVHRDAAGWNALAAHFPALPGARQIFDMAVDLVQTSCGFAVPFYDFAGERRVLHDWAAQKSDGDLRAYWAERNATSLDGRPTRADDDHG